MVYHPNPNPFPSRARGYSRANFTILYGHFWQWYILAGGLKMPPLRTYHYQMTDTFCTNIRLRSVAVAVVLSQKPVEMAIICGRPHRGAPTVSYPNYT